MGPVFKLWIVKVKKGGWVGGMGKWRQRGKEWKRYAKILTNTKLCGNRMSMRRGPEQNKTSFLAPS